MDCAYCGTLLSVVTTRAPRGFGSSRGVLRLAPQQIKLWRCRQCGFTERLFEGQVFGDCIYCFARIVESEYADNFPEMPVRLLVQALADPEQLKTGDYKYACSVCIRCCECKHCLPKQDFTVRGVGENTVDGSLKLRYIYMHHNCGLEWDVRHTARDLDAPLIDLRDVINTIVKDRRDALWGAAEDKAK